MKVEDLSENLEYFIALSIDGSYIRSTIFVDVTNELVKRFSRKIDRLSGETGVVKNLIDVTRVRSAQSTMDMYTLTHNKLIDSRTFRASKIAVLTHPDDSSHDFIETLLVNNCVTGKVFKNEDEALKWLRK